MGNEITIRDVYETQLAVQADVSGMRADVAALKAGVDVQLAHGARKMDDLGDADAALSARVALLEQARWRAAGAASLAGTVAGGAAGSLLSWLLTRH